MKKWFIISAFVVILLIVSITVCQCVIHAEKKKLSNPPEMFFDLSDYSLVLETFPYEKNVGPVKTKSVAVEKAKELWEERYGDLYVSNNKPVVVSYDPRNKCWLVNASLKDEKLDGAVPCVLICEDGTVLALWYG